MGRLKKAKAWKSPHRQQHGDCQKERGWGKGGEGKGGINGDGGTLDLDW